MFVEWSVYHKVVDKRCNYYDAILYFQSVQFHVMFVLAKKNKVCQH